ncbi:MAG: hypothetical protein ACRCWY_04380 [Cellulosilyticaceae bacterium]
MKNARITGAGIATVLPQYVTYFQEASVMEDLMIPPEKPDMEDLAGISAVAEVMDYKVIETGKAVSYEGQNLSGQKLIVPIQFKIQIKYIADECDQNLHAAHSNEMMQNVFIIIPTTVDGQNTCDLLRKNKFTLNCYIEDFYAMKKDARTLRVFVTYLVDLKFIQ